MKFNFTTFTRFLKTFFFSIVFFSASFHVFGQVPTTPPTNLNISNIDGDRFYVSFTRGNGAKRIIVASTSPVTAIPVNGADYLAGNFGQGNEISPGQFVVYNGTSNQSWIAGFNHSTTYYLRIFEYNGTDFNTEYLTTEFLEGNATTLTAPSQQASGITFSNVTGSGMTVNWTNGNGSGRILIARADEPVDVEPQDLVNYNWSSTFGQRQIGTGNFVVYDGSANSRGVTNLQPNRTYHFAVFEYNGSSGKVYLRPGSRSSQVTASAPTVAASNFRISNLDGDRFYYFFNNGNGSRRTVIAKKGSPVTAVPVDGVSYTHNITFGSGTEIKEGEFVVYDGNSNQSWLYGLEPASTYHLAVFEYNGTGTSTFYLTTEFLQGNASTLTTPTQQASDITFNNISGSGMTVNWTNGNGSGRILIARADGPVDVEPQDLVNYNWSSTYGQRQIGNGNFVIYDGSANSRGVTNLDPNRTYHFAVFEYNGSNAKLYLRPGARGSQVTASAPTVPASNFRTSNLDGDRFYYFFNNGNGERRIVIAKKGSPVTAVPVDGVSYAHNITFGSGTEIKEGEFVVYDGTSNQSWLAGLEPSTTYHLAVFEYNGTGTGTFYLTTEFLQANASTLTTPTQQASDITFSNITGTGMTVNWTNGNGNGRILIARADGPVDVEPQDLVNYNWSSAYGQRQIGTGNYVVYDGGANGRGIINLEPNRTYHFAVFEYNGANAKLYLKPAARGSQATASAPTVAASNFRTSNLDGDRFYYFFNNGNGERRIVIAKKGGAVTAVPEDGISYAHNITFGSGTEIKEGEFVVYDGNSNQSWLNGLEPGSDYHFAVFEYNGTGANTFYLTETFLEATQTTLNTPTVQSSNAFLSSRSNNSLNISWTRGDGSNRLLIARKDGPVNVQPEDGINYASSVGYGNRQIGTTGNYVLYNGTGNNVNVTNLESGTNYFFALFEFNGVNLKLYKRPGYAFAQETLGERPTVQVSNAQYSNIEFNSFDVSFTKGNGSRRLVLAREGSAVSGGPADLTSYTASSTFGTGDQIGTGNFVVYNDFGESFSLNGLESGKTYHLSFYEYAVSENGELYMAPAYTSTQTTKTNADLGVSAITAPVSSCNLSEAETVTIEITNFNSSPAGAFQVAYVVNGGEPVIENISGTNTIAGNGKLTYSFQAKVDLSVDGNYEIRAYTILEGDVNTNNDRQTITVNNSPETNTTISPDANICSGQSTLLQASGGISYLWNTGATTNLIDVSPTISTEYTVTITTEDGCEVEKRVMVFVENTSELPVISSTPDSESCEGGRILGTQLTIPVRWILDIDSEIYDLGESITVKANRSGIYTAVYVNENGCEIKSANFNFELDQLPELQVSGLTTICAGESLTLSIQGLRDLIWSTSQTGESITVSPTANTKYWVSGKYGTDCVFSDTLEVTVIPASAPEPVRQMLPPDGSLNLPQPISLSWTPGEFSVVYDVFVWEEGTEKPNQPIARDIQEINYTVQSLEQGKSFLWQVHSKNSCFVTEGPVQRFAAAGIPDLTIQSYTAPEAVVAGNSITVSWEVKNIGLGNTNNVRWKDRIWLSADLDLRRADDILLGEFDNPASLMQGESYTMTQEVRVPINLRGVYYLFVITNNDDGYCRIENGVCSNERRAHSKTLTESDDQNNLIFQTLSIGIPPLADLTVNNVGVTTDAFSGDSISVIYEVQNIGEREAKGLFWRFKRDAGTYSYSTGNSGGTSGGGSSVSVASAPTNISVTESCRIEYYWRDAIYLSQEPEFNISKSTKLQEYSVFLAEEDSVSTCIVGGNLPVNSKYSKQRELKLPDNVFGTYYLYIVSNFSGMFENEYSNNIRRSDPINVILTPPSDLAVIDLQVPAEIIAGTKMDISWIVENSGANPPNVNSWVDEVFISEQPEFDKSKSVSVFRKTFTTPLRFDGFGNSTPLPLENGDSYTVEAEALIPERLAGDYYVFVLTDTDNRVFEFETKGNNVKRSENPVKLITGERAELSPVSITLPDTVYRDVAFPVKYRIVNNGNKAAVGFNDRINWSTSSDPTKTPFNFLGSVLHRDSLPAGQAVERTALVALPKNAPDSIYFHIFTDVNDVIFEVDETNNRASNQMLGVKSPVVLTPETVVEIKVVDLTVQEFSIGSNTIGSGDQLNVNFKVGNLGPDDVTKSFISRVYLTRDSVLTEDDIYLTEFSRSKLVMGEVYETGRSVKIPDWISGEYFVYLWVDYRENVTEDQNKANNIAFRKLNIAATPAPDLVVTAIEAPETVISGESFYVKYTLENNGEGPTRFEWNDGFFLSTSPVLATGAQNIGFKRVTKTLAVGETLRDSALVKTPNNVSGNYYLIAKADYQNKIFEGFEGGETNNEGNRVILINLSDPTDLTISSFSIQEAAFLGDETTAEIEVTNIGDKPASGRLYNGFYLSGDQQFNGALDPLIGIQESDANILPGQSRTYNIKGSILDLDPGNYFGIGRTNLLASINEVNYENNLLVAEKQLKLDVRSLPLDVPTTNTLIAGTWRYYKVNVGANLDLVIDLASSRTVGSNDIFVSFGKVPSPNEFDFKGINSNRTNQRVLVPETKSGFYYILVKTDIPLAQNIELLARALPFSILSSNPSVVGNGTVTTTITGAGFKEGMEVSLLKDGNKVISATQVNLTNSMSGRLGWRLADVDFGIYDVEVKNPDGTTVILENGLEVEPSTGYSGLTYNILAPDVVRRGKTAFYNVVFKNEGNVDIPILNAQVTMQEDIIIYELKTQGGLKTNSTLDPLGRLADNPDYSIINGMMAVPLYGRDIRPGEEMSASFLLGNFTGNTFPMEVKYLGIAPSVLVLSLFDKIESTRQQALSSPEMFYEDRVLVQDLIGFRKAMIQNYMEFGYLTSNDTVGIDLNCLNCSLIPLESGFNPDGELIGTSFFEDASFNSGELYNWQINKYSGSAGNNPGWDLIKITNKLNINATKDAPFTIKVSSLDYNNNPGYLGGWYPAVDKCWTIVVADRGISGFDPEKFEVDLSGFLTHNFIYIGTFSVQQLDEFTISLCYKAYVPGPGQQGVPGAPGGWGEDGSPGGPGGPGAPGIEPGQGGRGGIGGPGGGKRGANGGFGDCPIGENCTPNDPNNPDDPDNPDGPDNPDNPNDPDDPDDPKDNDPPKRCPYPEGCDNDNGPEDNINDCSQGVPGTPSGTPCHSEPGKPVVPPGGGGGGGGGGGAGPSPTGCSEGEGSGGAGSFFSSPSCGNLFTGLGCGAAVIGCGAGAALCATVIGCGVGALTCTVSLTSCMFGIYDALVPNAKPTDKKDEWAMCLFGLVSPGVSAAVDIALCGAKEILCKPVVSSCDPNEILGPEGYGDERFVSKEEELPFTIFFENDPVFATAPAQRVVVRQQLDPNLDPASFRLNGFGFQNMTFDVPPGLTNYTTKLNTAAEIGVDVNVTFGLDPVNNELFWALQSVDAKTGLPPFEALAGFLPVNDSTAIGEGFVSYTIKAGRETVTGDSLRAMANIFFDTNAPIVTNEAFNTVDAGAPTLLEIKDVQVEFDSLMSFTVLTVDDQGGSGVKGFDVFVSEDGGPYILQSLDNAVGEKFTFRGTPGKNYCLATVVRDNVNNSIRVSEEDVVCFTTPEDEINISKVFTLQSAVSGQGQINILPNGTVFNESEEVQIEAMPAEGWVFVRWEGDISSTQPSINLVMDNNKFIRAIFIEGDLPVFAVNTSTEGSGTISLNPEGGQYESGAEVTLTANPASGWEFVAWEGDVESSDASITLTMDRDKNLKAKFVQILAVALEGTSLSCQDAADGTIKANVTGGIAPYEYTWLKDGDPIASVPESLDALEAGNYQVTVKDSRGKTVVQSTSIIVEDKEAPVIKIKENITVNLNAAGNGSLSVEMVDDGSTDNCGIESMLLDKTTFACTDLGEQQVTLTAKDAAGNETVQQFTISVRDNLAPKAIGTSAELFLDENGTATLTASQVDGGSTDNCAVASIAVNKTTFNCADLGDNEVVLTVRDAAGNESAVTVTVKVTDEIPPVILNVPEDRLVYAGASSGYTLPDFISSSITEDNCETVEFTQSPVAGSTLAANQNHTITLTAKDASRNITTATFDITVEALQVVAVEALDMLEVTWNTPFNALTPPANVQVTLNNGEKIILNVAWQASSYEPLIAGVYSLVGTITLTDEITNPDQVQASLMVLISEKPLPQDIILNITNRNRNPNIPIGNLETVDPADDVHVYELTDGSPDNSFFILEGNVLTWDKTKKIAGRKDFTIEVSSTDRAGNTITKLFTLTFESRRLTEIEVLNTFTPNGDGANDTWGIPDLFGFDNLTISVLDRSGRVVFKTNDPRVRWDGTFEGEVLPVGTYIYVLEVKDPNEVRSGVINLLIK
ncbi:gliding motility-associated C-terminal domain-containing protein [Aquiflexum balticum DSM 16537]|uniref:Gliding motility-associated C-terminal domain-containing protein n=1 Tax=Aquiflexum balticum DSM 16537 TaxID=758820 RepID=A0A1W2H632_9BACT|nr:CARDB domain-containing protein [Aquiflexum balticum]SMD44234.1 gliding motility-associated C-terminal domain-containing protein [Aquiflexum balticum DSM 16537]